jgi:hypothetical protein
MIVLCQRPTGRNWCAVALLLCTSCLQNMNGLHHHHHHVTSSHSRYVFMINAVGIRVGPTAEHERSSVKFNYTFSLKTTTQKVSSALVAHTVAWHDSSQPLR